MDGVCARRRPHSRDVATYIGIVVVGHIVMRLIAGPASSDHLARRPIETAMRQTSAVLSRIH